jgi:hypothetical protein
LESGFESDLEQLQHSVRRPGNDRPVAHHENRTLHQLRVFEQKVDHRVGRLVVARCELQFLEILVLSKHFGRLIGNLLRDPRQRRSVERLIEVFDDVELDVSLAQNFQRAARLASARVVVQQRGRHGVPPSCLPPSIGYFNPARCRCASRLKSCSDQTQLFGPIGRACSVE